MIDFQSQLTGVAELPFLNQKSAAGMSSPGGSNERSECHFMCCSGVETGEGELNHRGLQSAVIKVGRVSLPRSTGSLTAAVRASLKSATLLGLLVAPRVACAFALFINPNWFVEKLRVKREQPTDESSKPELCGEPL